MKARLYHGFPPPPEANRYRLEWSFTIDGYAQVVADRVAVTRYSHRIPANDRDSYRW